MATAIIPTHVPQAYRQFLELVADVRPALHRYCARMTGSVTDGEDVVQETLAKAFYELAMLDELPALRPWLFRVAHNAAIDFGRRHDRSRVELVAETPEMADMALDDATDPDSVRAALATFLMLPPLQRSAVILKDVLGHSAAEVAATLATTVPAVKAALVRGRDRLRQEGAREDERRPEGTGAPPSRLLEQYVRLFNAGDWDGVRALLAEEVRLDLVSTAVRRGKAVGFYLGRYAAEPDVRLATGTLEARPVLWTFVPKTSDRPKYFIELEESGGRISHIRDFRYVPYILSDLPSTPHHVA